MAVDSIIASPTNNVRVIVAEASGCCASEVSAVATARPSANAGPMVPKPVVMPAMTMEADGDDCHDVHCVSLALMALVSGPWVVSAALGLLTRVAAAI